MEREKFRPKDKKNKNIDAAYDLIFSQGLKLGRMDIGEKLGLSSNEIYLFAIQLTKWELKDVNYNLDRKIKDPVNDAAKHYPIIGRLIERSSNRSIIKKQQVEETLETVEAIEHQLVSELLDPAELVRAHTVKMAAREGVPIFFDLLDHSGKRINVHTPEDVTQWCTKWNSRLAEAEARQQLS